MAGHKSRRQGRNTNIDKQKSIPNGLSTPTRELNEGGLRQPEESSYSISRTPNNRERWSWKKAVRSRERRNGRLERGSTTKQGKTMTEDRIFAGPRR